MKKKSKLPGEDKNIKKQVKKDEKKEEKKI